MMRIGTLLSLSLLLGAGTVLTTSCGDDEDIILQPAETPKTPDAEEVWTLRLSGARGEDTKALTQDDINLISSWAAGEKVYVYRQLGGSSDLTYAGTLSAKSSGASSELTGSLSGSYSVNDKLYLYTCLITFDYSGQDGTLEGIAANFDPMSADATVTVVDTDKREITATPANFAPMHAICRFVFKDNGGNELLVKSLRITAERLVNSYSSETNKNYEPEYDGTTPLTVQPSEATSSLYVSMADANSIDYVNHPNDPYYPAIAYTFNATVGDKTYEGTKNAKLINGSFARNVTVTLSQK